MTGNKLIAIILPSYNDARIGEAINSVRKFDDVGIVKLVVVDGGSTDEVKTLIREKLTADDVFISEPDKGIFDALNKGLEACDTEYIGWLGSDDMFTGAIQSSVVANALDDADIFMGDLYFVNNGYVTRKTHGWPAKAGLMKLGLHNPHYATFGRASLFKSEQFDLGLRGSDIEYFIKIFDKKPRVVTSSKIMTLQAEGGFSNSNAKNILRTNMELVPMYARYTNRLLAYVAVILKLVYKTLSKVYFSILRKRVKGLIFF